MKIILYLPLVITPLLTISTNVKQNSTSFIVFNRKNQITIASIEKKLFTLDQALKKNKIRQSTYVQELERILKTEVSKLTEKEQLNLKNKIIKIINQYKIKESFWNTQNIIMLSATLLATVVFAGIFVIKIKRSKKIA